jgi:hypothetical protein
VPACVGAVSEGRPTKGGHRVARSLLLVGWTLPEGELSAHLPDDVRAGDLVSGRLFFHAADGDRDDELSLLPPGERPMADHVIEAAGTTVRVGDGVIAFRVPSGVTGVPLSLRDAAGVVRGEVDVPVADAGTGDTAAGAWPPYCQLNGLVRVDGRFDGDLRNTEARIGDADLQVWAESPRRIVAIVLGTATGRQAVRLLDGDWKCRGAIDVLGLTVHPRQARATAGAGTTIRMTVTGLERLRADLRPVIDLSAWIGGGWSVATEHVVDPTAALDGCLVLTTDVVAPERGLLQTLGRIRLLEPDPGGCSG